MTTRPPSRDRIAIGLAPGAMLALLLIATTAATAAPAERPERPDKISPGVLWRQSMQERYALDRAERDANKLIAMGISITDLSTLHCAVYVERELSNAQIAGLGAQGVELITTTYTPPVPGRHPFGVYLADINHASFGALRADPAIRRVDAAPRSLMPHNDVSSVVTDTSSVRLGLGVSRNTGAGVTIAIADSGIDLTHPDFPTPIEAYDLTDGTNTFTWGLDVANTVTSHGTHVTGSALGSGAASFGGYSGSAPGANLVFYKIGNDASGGATLEDLAEAVNRAAEIGCDIFSLSYGGLSDYLDGSEFLEQVLDSAYGQGMLCFTSAGNSGDDKLHVTVDCPANGTSEVIRFQVDNKGFEAPFEFFEYFQLNWQDTPGDSNLRLELLITDDSASLERVYYDFSIRNTELEVTEFLFTVPPNEIRTYEFVVRNDADEPVTAQLYANIGFDSYFPDADPGYTVGSPAVGDTVIAVGSVNHRTRYRNDHGVQHDWSGFTGDPLQISHFSSRGPRIDGVIKPDIVAPGAMMISCRDSGPGLAADPRLIIDNDGANLDGSGPAQYYINAGTSMACPTAAGSAALLFEAHPYLSTEAMRAAIIKNASRADSPDGDWGYGIIGAKQSVLHGPATGVPGDLDGDFMVNVADLAILIDNFTGDDDLADINNDRVVDTADLGLMIRNFGTGEPASP